MASIFSPLTKNIGIDLGTCTTQVYVEGRGIVLSEPSVIATDERNQKVVAVGRNAENLLIQSPEVVKIHRPLVNGVIADYSVTSTLLNYILSRAVRTVQRVRVNLGVPAIASDVEKRAVLEALYRAGAKETSLIETGAAAAIGAGLPVLEPTGSMVVDIGGGTTNVAVLSLGGIVVSEAIHTGSIELDETLRDYLRMKYAVVTDDATVEEMKIYNGSAILPLEDRHFYFTGRGLDDGLEREVSLKSSEIYEVMGRPLLKIIELIRRTLKETPPELAADIMEQGIVLTGGGSLLKGLDQLVAQETGVPVMVAAEPETAVAKGAYTALKNRQKFDSLIQGVQTIYKRRF